MTTYNYRSWVILSIVTLVLIIYIIWIFQMQVLDNSYVKIAESNTRRIEIIYPSRGLFYDRNGKLLVDNQPAYDLLITPKKMKTFDTIELLSVLDISKEQLDRALKKCKKYSLYKPSILIAEITYDKYAILQEKLYKYTGFSVQKRTIRKYNINYSGDVFGYIGEVSQKILDKDTAYNQGDYIGITGIEKTYDKIIRGKKGKRIVLVDNFNRKKGRYKDGIYDIPVQVGKSLQLTIDMELQKYAYELMKNKKGGIVAIEPQTGEIILKVSNPTYDPQLMSGLQRGKNYKKLEEASDKPLFDRTLMASYPPGSTFKTIQALVGLQEGVITPSTCFECHGGSSFRPLFVRCHGHSSPLGLRKAIQESCNPYFVHTYRRILENSKYNSVRDAYEAWRNYMTSFGLGRKICPDFSNELKGNIPSVTYYDRQFKSDKWHWLWIMSLSIGQGELLITPLQMANLAATIANRGYYITPHIVRSIEGVHKKTEKHYALVDAKHYDVILDGMSQVISMGTGKRAAVDGIDVCGKTGTVQNPHGPAHSVFIALAPKNNPKIAIAVYIENGEWGVKYAAPIAGLLIEKYLKGEISENKKRIEEEMFNTSLYKPDLPN